MQDQQEVKKPKLPVSDNAPQCCSHRGWTVVWFVLQALMIVCYCLFVSFDGIDSNETYSYTEDPDVYDAQNLAVDNMIQRMYPMWMDIHVMIFIGFGFLMAFLKTHCWSSIGFNYVCAAWCIQCGILFQGMWSKVAHFDFSEKIHVNLFKVVEGEFCAGAFLITMGAVLGKCTFPQYVMLATLESIFFTLNAVIIFEVMHVVDIGGAMTIHMFGAYFGLAATYFFQNEKALKDETKQYQGGYISQLLAMIGTLFLFIYWPSFNAILGHGLAQHRAVVNTVLSITASCLSSVYMCHCMAGKMDIEVILNATLAGGVMMGASCDLITMPGMAMLAGAIAGCVSCYGYMSLNSWMQEKLKLHDSCGVQFLHGIPGTLGAITSVVCVACAEYNFENQTQLNELFGQLENGRTMTQQIGYQVAGIAVTWAIAIPSGLFCGLVVSRLPMPYKQFDDNPHYENVVYGDDTARYNERGEDEYLAMQQAADEKKAADGKSAFQGRTKR